MKHIIELDMTNESDKYKLQLINRLDELAILIEFIELSLFRPHRKHGYNCLDTNALDDEMNALIESEDTSRAIGILEDEYYRVKNELGLSEVV